MKKTETSKASTDEKEKNVKDSVPPVLLVKDSNGLWSIVKSSKKKSTGGLGAGPSFEQVFMSLDAPAEKIKDKKKKVLVARLIPSPPEESNEPFVGESQSSTKKRPYFKMEFGQDDEGIPVIDLEDFPVSSLEPNNKKIKINDSIPSVASPEDLNGATSSTSKSLKEEPRMDSDYHGQSLAEYLFGENPFDKLDSGDDSYEAAASQARRTTFTDEERDLIISQSCSRITGSKYEF